MIFHNTVVVAFSVTCFYLNFVLNHWTTNSISLSRPSPKTLQSRALKPHSLVPSSFHLCATVLRHRCPCVSVNVEVVNPHCCFCLYHTKSEVSKMTHFDSIGVKNDIVGSYPFQSSLQYVISLNPNSLLCIAISAFNPSSFSSHTLFYRFIRFHLLVISPL